MPDGVHHPATVEAAFGADLTTDPDTWTWTDLTDRIRSPIRIRQGRRPGAQHTEPGTCTLTIANDDGNLTPLNPTSVYWPDVVRNLPIRISVHPDLLDPATDGTRLGGFADSYELDWPDGTDNTCNTIIEVAGITRRLARDRRLRSAPVRWIPTTDPIAYWPMEDGPLAEAAAALVGTSPMRSWSGTHPSGAVVTTPQWGSGSLAPWLPQVLSRSGSAGLSIVYAPVAMMGFTNTWTVDFAYTSGTDAKTTVLDINPTYLGGDTGWQQLTFIPDANVVQVAMNAEPEVSFDAGALFDGQPHHIRFKCSQSGANVAWQVYIDGTLNVGTTSGAMTLYPISRLAHVAEEQTGANVAVGHFAVWITPPDVDDAVSALRGWRGETAAERVTRLLAEENIPAAVEAATAGADSVLLGPQTPSQLLTILREAETTDGGLLIEIPFGLGYLPRSYRYNREPTLTLDTDLGDVQIPFKPAYDDRDLTNDVEVRRAFGSTVNTEATGPLAPTGGTGRYQGGVSVNTDDDEPLDNIADWQAHLGTVDEYRTPGFRFSPADRSELVEPWMAAGVGRRYTGALRDLSQFPGRTADQLIDGWSEMFDAGPVWQVEVSGSPASPYQVGVVEGDGSTTEPALRLDTGGSTLAVAVDSDDTTLRLATTVGPEWTTTAGFPADFPFDIDVDGEQVTVTTITTATPALINVGTVAHGNNASVTPNIPTGMTVDVGQVILGWAAIRNSGTGTVDLPTGWTELARSGNTLFFGRYYVTGVTAPVITFTGGVANADTSARLWAMSGVSLVHDDGDRGAVLLSPQGQLNASTQNIAYPALSIRRRNGVAFVLAWKQDDATGVAVPAGMDAELLDNSTTTGDDQMIAAYYDIQTTATNIAAGTLTVTGGAAAISRAVTAALRPLQTATVTRAVNGVAKSHPVGTAVRLWKPPVVAL